MIDLLVKKLIKCLHKFLISIYRFEYNFNFNVIDC